MSNTKYNRIKTQLAEKEISNRELAEYLGVTVHTVSRWCTNTGQPSLETLYRIADYLDINICELLVPNKK